MKPLTGKLLSAEQSIRRAIIDNTKRQQMIEAIAKHLRVAATSRQGKGNISPPCTPREWYAARV